MQLSKLKKEERSDWKAARTIVLKSDDPCVWVEEGGAEAELWEVMHSIYLYIQHVLYMDDNPLRYLRKYFPDFNWEFHKIARLEMLAPDISKADYIWSNHEDLFGSEGIVTATEKGRPTPRILLYRPQSKHSSKVQERENVRLRSLIPDIRFVYSEYGPGTVIR